MKKKLLTMAAVAAGTALLTFLVFLLALNHVAGKMLLAEHPKKADAIVILYHSTEVYRRIPEAARLYHEGYAPKVVLNGGRKIDVVKKMEAEGLKRDYRWYDEFLPVFEYLGVPSRDVIIIEAADSFDTAGEARYVGAQLLDMGIDEVLLTTNRFHSGRAGHIWKSMYAGHMDVTMVPIRDEPFPSRSWWSDRRLFKYTLYELGSWVFLYLN